MTDNYNLLPESPGINAGTDGTDIGIYGGAYSFPLAEEELYSGMPAIPQIIELNIQNAVLPVDGTLNVQVKARVQE